MKNNWIVMALMLVASVANAAYVTIGDPGNPADDSGFGYGAVGYVYKIGNEVTIAEFQASGAGDGDEGFWNQDGETVGPNAPAVNLTLYDAMRYCNWLTTGSVDEGVYKFDFEGSFTYALSRPVIMEGALDSVANDPSRIYALPTEHEWYKAAYWDGRDYTLYADGTSDMNNPPPSSTGATGWAYYDAEVPRDTSLGALEQNGTVNMMGNVWEWLEDPEGIIRGGGYYNPEYYLRSDSGRDTWDPADYDDTLGFRTVELVPEPATLGIIVLFGAGIVGVRRFFLI